VYYLCHRIERTALMRVETSFDEGETVRLPQSDPA
jgi:hypothetical protein